MLLCRCLINICLKPSYMPHLFYWFAKQIKSALRVARVFCLLFPKSSILWKMASRTVTFFSFVLIARVKRVSERVSPPLSALGSQSLLSSHKKRIGGREWSLRHVSAAAKLVYRRKPSSGRVSVCETRCARVASLTATQTHKRVHTRAQSFFKKRKSSL